MKKIVVLFLGIFLSACATLPAPQRTVDLFHDNWFAPPKEQMNPADVFALNDEMRKFLKTEIESQAATKGPRKALFDALYDKKLLRLEYDTSFTRNASEAFSARTGNCLSLVIMTGAFAKQLGLQVVYQNVLGNESWSRPTEDLYFASTHVNLSLVERPAQIIRLADGSSAQQNFLVTIDFVPPEEILKQRRRVLKENTVVAMFMNNRAAETLALGQVDEAYWWARAAAKQDPQFMTAYNTLGVIYRRHRHLNEAVELLRYVLEIEPENIQAMSNLSFTLADLGQNTEAQALAAQVKQLRANPPYYFFDQGMAAMKKADYRTAKEMFTKELSRDRSNHEFHAWLAAAYAGLDNMELARRHLGLAIENSPTRAERELYSHQLAQIGSSNLH